jgi:FkbM family methyltransferase
MADEIEVRPVHISAKTLAPLAVTPSLKPLAITSIGSRTDNSHPVKSLLSRFFPDMQGGVVLDVGANIGQSATALLSLFPGADLHCFEPAPSAFMALSRNTARLPAVRVHHLAVGEVEGTVLITDAGTSTMNGISDTEGAKVSSVRVDRFCRDNGIEHVRYLKVDTEGYDLHVLRGAAGILPDTDFVECEVSANEYNRYHVGYIDVFEFMTKAGFSVLHILDQTIEWQDGGRPVLRRFNPVFVNNKLVNFDGLQHR